MSICRLPQLEQTSLSRANRTLRLQPLRTPDALHRTDARAAAEVIVSRLKEQVSAAGVGAANSSSVSLQPSMLELSGRAPRHHRPRSVKDHLLYANIDTHHSAQIAVLFTASVTEKRQGVKRFRRRIAQFDVSPWTQKDKRNQLLTVCLIFGQISRKPGNQSWLAAGASSFQQSYPPFQWIVSKNILMDDLLTRRRTANVLEDGEQTAW